MSKQLCFLLMAAVLLAACHKNGNNAQVEDLPGKPLVTKEGVPPARL